MCLPPEWTCQALIHILTPGATVASCTSGGYLCKQGPRSRRPSLFAGHEELFANGSMHHITSLDLRGGVAYVIKMKEESEGAGPFSLCLV